MLSDDQKRLIREEEIYRAEVKNELEAKSQASRLERFCRFLNSPLGLWFLSALILSAGGLLYSVVADRIAAAKNNAAIIEKLDDEIACRLTAFNEIGIDSRLGIYTRAPSVID